MRFRVIHKHFTLTYEHFFYYYHYYTQERVLTCSLRVGRVHCLGSWFSRASSTCNVTVYASVNQCSETEQKPSEKLFQTTWEDQILLRNFKWIQKNVKKKKSKTKQKQSYARVVGLKRGEVRCLHNCLSCVPYFRCKNSFSWIFAMKLLTATITWYQVCFFVFNHYLIR